MSAEGDSLATALRKEHGEAIESARISGGDLTVRVRREALFAVCAALRETHGFSRLVDLCGVDFPDRSPRFEVVYHLRDPTAGRRARVKVAAGEGEPVPSMTGVWRAADGFEREAWDLLGLHFEGHPDLSRILLWDGFEGHPLRKDFPVEGTGTGASRQPLSPSPGEGNVGAALRGRPGGEGSDELELAFGPRHPAIQGVLLLRLRMDERIVDCRPVIGHVHRGLEKLLETLPFAEGMPLTNHLDFAAPFTANLAYAGAVERLLGIAAPPRARFVRTILVELERIASHLLWLGTHAADVGLTAPLALALRERERILELPAGYLAAYPGPSGIRPGGLSHDLPPGWVEECRAVLAAFSDALGECEGPLTESRLWKKRTVGLGVLAADAAADLGVTGPALRGSGVAWDLRRADPYEAYGEVDFEVPVGRTGDTYDRYRVRVEEMRQACRIAVQCLDRLPEGPVLADLPEPLDAPAGAEVYHGVEGPRGEIGFYLVGGGTDRPHRCHLRAPSFANLQALPELCRGETVGDLVTLLGTLDVALGEVDR